MTEYQKFASAFIDEGIRRGWSLTRMKKVAADLPRFVKQGGLTDVLSSGGSALKGLASAAVLPVAIAAAAPPILGGLAGHGLAKATDIDDKEAVADLQSEEMQKAYSDEARRLKAIKRAQRVARTPSRGPSLYGA